MGREKAFKVNFPPGGYFCIKPALINVDQAEVVESGWRER